LTSWLGAIRTRLTWPAMRAVAFEALRVELCVVGFLFSNR